jgi:hypothetical protein
MPIITPTMQTANAAMLGDPAQAGVTTAQGQLSGILNKGGPLMQQAATQGAQLAASKGLLNSSMGVQAAQAAVMDRAIPLAQSDASAMNQGNQFNTSAQNQFALQNNQTTNAMNQWNAGQQNESTLKALDVNSREALAGIEAEYKTTMQTSSSAESMYNQVLKNISDIQGNKDIGDKGAAITSQLAWLRSGMSMLQNLSGSAGLITF